VEDWDIVCLNSQFQLWEHAFSSWRIFLGCVFLNKVQDPRSYFPEHDLWNLSTLQQHAEHNCVSIRQSKKYPCFYIAHYKDEAQWDSKWNTFTEMCRGIIFQWFAGQGKILTWPYKKFHNLGAVPETSYDYLKTLGEFEVAEKLDGSMILLYYDEFAKEYRCSTKGSLDSEHGEYATSILPEHLKQKKWVEEYTLMFELISKRFRIVVDYTKKDNYQEGLYLIGARNLKSGKLLSYKEVQDLAQELKLPTIKTYKFDSIDQLLATAKDLPVLEEGFVLRFPGDILVKVKGDAYLRAHRFISQLSDKHILEAVAEGVADTLVEVAPEEYRQDVIEKVAYFKHRKLDLLNQCYKYFAEAPKENGRKEFALWVQANVKPNLKGCLFQLMDCKLLTDTQLYGIISKYEDVSSETRI
jgi:putative RNA ligase